MAGAVWLMPDLPGFLSDVDATVLGASASAPGGSRWCQMQQNTDPSTAGFFWLALCLADLAYGGPEEGGWWYQSGTLIVDPNTYQDLGMASSAYLLRGMLRPCGRTLYRNLLL